MNNLLDVVTKGITVFFCFLFFFFLRQIDKFYKTFIKQVVLDDELEEGAREVNYNSKLQKVK